MKLYEELFYAGPLDMRARDFWKSVAAAAEFERAAKPWMLVELPGDTALVVAKRRTWWMRIITAALNVPRRRKARRMRAARAHYFAPEQAGSRVRASQ